MTVYDADKNKPFEHASRKRPCASQARRRQIDGLERDARTLLEMRGLAKAAETYDWRSRRRGRQPPSRRRRRPARQRPKTGCRPRSPTLHESVLALQDQTHRLAVSSKAAAGWAGSPASPPSRRRSSAASSMSFTLVGWFAGAGVGLVAGRRAAGRSSCRAAGARRSPSSASSSGSSSRPGSSSATATADARATSDRMAQDIVRRRDRDLAAAKQRRDQRGRRGRTRSTTPSSAPIEPQLRRAQRDARRRARPRRRRRRRQVSRRCFEQNVAARQQADRENAERFDARRTEANARARRRLARRWPTRGSPASAKSPTSSRRCTTAAASCSPTWSADDLARLAAPGGAARGDPLRPVPAAAAAGQERHARGQAARPRRASGWCCPPSMTLAEQPRLVITADGRRPPRRGRGAAAGHAALAHLACPPARCGSRSSTPPASARTSPPSCTWPTTTSSSSPAAASGPTPSTSTSGWRLVAEHMEKVLQKYLRNEFATIHEYNKTRRRSGRAVPRGHRRELPRGLQRRRRPQARRRSRRAARAAACTRCVSVDRSCACRTSSSSTSCSPTRCISTGTNDRLVWRYPLFEKLPLELDRLPDDDRLSDVLRLGRPAVARGEQGRSAVRGGRPAAGQDVDRATAPASWSCPSAAPAPRSCSRCGSGIGTSQHVRHRRQDRLRQEHAAARAHHQRSRCTTAPTRSSSTSSTSRRASSSKPTPPAGCRTPG